MAEHDMPFAGMGTGQDQTDPAIAPGRQNRRYGYHDRHRPATADEGYHISVLTGPVCKALLACSEAVHQTYLYDKRMSLSGLRQQGFDVVIDFDDVRDYERLRLLYRLAPSYVLDFNKSVSARYAPQLVWRDSELHITERSRAVLALFNLPTAPFRYSLGGDPSAADALAPYLSRSSDEWLIAINPFTGYEDKDFPGNRWQG